MQTEQGDLVQKARAGEFDVIVHGYNCFCQMGASIAKTIKQVFPAAYQADLTTVAGDHTKLGTYSVAQVDVSGRVLVIVNGYTQYNWRGKGLKADYAAIRQVFRRVKQAYVAPREPSPGCRARGGRLEHYRGHHRRRAYGRGACVRPMDQIANRERPH